MKTTDTIFSLKISLMDEMRKSANYLQLADYIKQNGCFKINGLNVYNAELALIFMSKKLPAYNKATKKDTAINGGKYIESYRQGYIEGGNRFKEDFVKHFSYGNNAELYVRDIHWNFFHNECGAQQHEGWQFVKSNYPLLITHKAIREFGYYSGIVSEVEVLVKQYPNLFKAFDKCEHKEIDAKQEHKEGKEPTHLQLALAYFYIILAEYKPTFTYWEGGAEAAYKKVIADHKPKAGKTAWKAFQQTFADVQKTKVEGRKKLCDGGAKNFTVVCELLKQYPEALTSAKKELQ